MTPNEASRQREVVIKHHTTSEVMRYHGNEVYSVTALGIVVAGGPSRIFYPWHRVEYFVYDIDDVSARKAIQGW